MALVPGWPVIASSRCHRPSLF